MFMVNPGTSESIVLYITVFQNFYLIDAHLSGLLIIITSRRLLYSMYKEVKI